MIAAGGLAGVFTFSCEPCSSEAMELNVRDDSLMAGGELLAVGTFACKVCSSVPLKLDTGTCSFVTTKVGLSDGASILAPCASSVIVPVFPGSKPSLVENNGG